MLRSNLAHKLAITVDQDAGVIESLTVFPDGVYDAEPIEDGCVSQYEETSPRLTSNVDVTVVMELPAPETAAYLQRMEDEKRNRQHGAATDNRSFLAKYVSCLNILDDSNNEDIIFSGCILFPSYYSWLFHLSWVVKKVELHSSLIQT